ncbi:MAG: xanthine dehydrogenase family protein molybdopterin-binding subunit [Planctomycetia bacterium]|nr:xanthine dehydrogenase family protein molybdopterin-binding subunit [Planctomycetia bacterium]
MKSVGERVPKLDAADKAAGKARYVQDLRLPGMLEAKVLRSTVPHGRIVSVDVSEAWKVRGVRAILTAKDIPAKAWGYAKDTTALKGDRVRRIGDELAAVAATDIEAAIEACERIKVVIEPLPAVYDIEATLAPGAPVLHESKGSNLVQTHHYEHGDVAAAFAKAAKVVEGTFTLPAQQHAALGPVGAVAEWDANGRLTLHDPTQIPFLVQRDLAEALDISPADLRIVQPAIGGAFGARLDLYPHEAIAALLARKAGAPVRLLFSRDEDFQTDPVRPRTIVKLRTAAAADGTLLARDADILVDCGAYVSWGSMTPVVMVNTFGNFYQCPAAKFRARTVWTNTQPTGAFRGFGNPELLFAVETQMDELARALKLDPIEFRLKNANRPEEVTPAGGRITSCGFKEVLEAVKAKLKRPAAPAEPHLKRGIGVAAVFHVGGGARIYRSDGCGATVKVDDFGKATVIVGATDIGQGMETAMAQIAAEELGIPVSMVRVATQADTDVRPWDVGVHASRTTFIAGNAVRLAAKEAKKQIEDARAALKLPPDAPVDKVVRAEHFRQKGRLISASAFYDPPTSMVDKANHGNVSAAYTWGCHGVEVEVDVETGQAVVKRVVAAHDVGRAINPMLVEGQIEGGVVQGLGYAMFEECVLKDGRMQNGFFLDYRIPGIKDVPDIETVLVETGDPEGPFGAKGIGEAPIVPIGPAIANAIADATGVRMREFPMTPERVWRELRNSR